MKLKYPFAVIVWDDAESEAEWISFDDLRLETTIAITCGFVLKEDDKYLILGDSYLLDHRNKSVSGITKIPKAMIVERHEPKLVFKKRVKEKDTEPTQQAEAA